MRDEILRATTSDLDDDDYELDANFNFGETEYFSYERWKNLLANKQKNDVTAIHVNI